MPRRPKHEFHSNIVASPPLLNFCGDPTAVITVPLSPAPTSHDTPPPSVNRAKLITLTRDASCRPDNYKATPEIDMPWLRERQPLSEHWQMRYKTRISFRYSVHDVAETCIVSTESLCTQKVLVSNPCELIQVVRHEIRYICAQTIRKGQETRRRILLRDYVSASLVTG